MKRKSLFLAVLVFLLAISIGISGAVSAASSGSISFLDSSDQPEYQMNVSGLVDDNGFGCDLVTMMMTDANGVIVDIDVDCIDLVAGVETDETDWGSYEGPVNEPTLGPITYTLYDTHAGDACDSDENSVACGDLLLSGVDACIAENYYQPPSLPAGTARHICGGKAGSGCTLVIPEGSVVGDTPYNTQVYWAPGKVSPGIFLNPGTYIVVGEDKTGQYYKIVLACQFVWVPVADMQPSYQLPQNGAPLPTREVS